MLIRYVSKYLNIFKHIFIINLKAHKEIVIPYMSEKRKIPILNLFK